MTNTKLTKRALFASLLSLLLCISMLVGSTFAWFTDSATTGVGSIVAGTLDIDLVDANGVSLEGKTIGFVDLDNNDLWEPGCRYTLETIKLINKGNLHAKYKVVISATTGNVDLAEVIDVYEGETKLGTLRSFLDMTSGIKEGVIAPGATLEFGTLTLVMQEGAGNDYQGKSITDISITVLATQATVESDSIDNQYDKDALYGNQPMATNDAELAEVLNEALTNKELKEIYLKGNFGATTLPVGTNGISLIALSGTTMESLNINGAKNIVIDGFTFDAAKSAQTYVNKLNGTATAYTASIYDDRRAQIYTGALAPVNVTIKNCTFSGNAIADATGGYTAINFDDGGAGTRIAGITIEGCTFNSKAFSYIYIQNIDDASVVVIKDNIFNGEANSTTWTAVAVQQLNDVEVEITGNSFTNWNPNEGAIVVSRKSGSAAPATATITGNTFNGAVNDNKFVIQIRRTGNTAHTVSNNTYNLTGITLNDTVTSSEDTLSTAVAVWYRQYNK